MATDTKVSKLIINKLTQAQYNEIENKNPSEIYLISDLLPTQIDQNGKFLTTNGVNTAWITPDFAKNDEVVKLNGIQTITGAKIFKGVNTVFQNTSIDITQTPTENIDMYPNFLQDKNGIDIGFEKLYDDRLGYTYHGIGVVAQKSDNTKIYSEIGVRAYKNGTMYAVAPTTPSDATANEIATANWVRNLISVNSGVPTGTISAFAGSTPPAGYLICDGAAISRTTYANLFSVIGTTYGAGDGNSTFNLPSFSGARLSVLYVPGSPVASWLPNGTFPGGLPQIIGTATYGRGPYGGYSGSGALSWGGVVGAQNQGQGGSSPATLYFNAANSSAVYNRDDNGVIPTSVAAMGIIKY